MGYHPASAVGREHVVGRPRVVVWSRPMRTITFRLARMLPLLSVLLFLGVGSTPARTPRGGATVVIEGMTMKIVFPVGIRPGTVWFRLDGQEVPRELLSGTDPEVRWSDGQTLSMSLHRVKRALGTKWVRQARLWGLMADGSRFWQLVDLPGKDRKAAPAP